MNKAEFQLWNSSRPGPPPFLEVAPGVFVVEILGEIIVTDEARASSDPGELPRWLISALLTAAEAIPEALRTPSMPWTIHSALTPLPGPAGPDEAEILGLLASELVTAGHYIFPLAAPAGSSGAIPLRATANFATASPGSNLASSISAIVSDLGAYSSRPASPPPACKELNEAFSNELLWRWDLDARSYEGLLGRIPVGFVVPGVPQSVEEVLDGAFRRAWSSPEDLDDAAQTHDLLRESLGDVRRQLQDKRRKRPQLSVSPPVARADVMSWAAERAILKLPLPGGKSRLNLVFDGSHGEPTIRIPALWSSSPIPGAAGILMRRGPRPFWVELVPAAGLPEPDARDALIDSIAAAVLGRGFIRSCTALDPWMRGVSPARPMAHANCEALIYVDAPALETWLKFQAWLWVAGLFGVETWMWPLERAATAEASEGFDADDRERDQTRRQSAPPTLTRAQREGACAERNEARRALFDGLQNSATPLLLGAPRRVPTFPRKLYGTAPLDLESLIHAACFMLLVDKGGASPVLGATSGGAAASRASSGTVATSAAGAIAGGVGATSSLMQLVDRERLNFQQGLSWFKDWLAENGLRDHDPQLPADDDHESNDTEDDRGPWDDAYEHHDQPGDWFPMPRSDGQETEEERRRRRKKADKFRMDLLGTYTWFHWTNDYGIRLFPDKIAKAAAGPASALSAVQRFGALLLKVALHEAHHFVEELALSELELSLGPSPTPLFRRWMKRYARTGGGRNMNEALANADALDRAHWLIRGKGNRALQRYASPGLKGNTLRTQEVDRFLERFVRSQSGWYRRAKFFRRVGGPGTRTVSPKTSSGPMLPRHHGDQALPLDGSDYGVGLALWILHEVLPLLPGVARPDPNLRELLGPLALSFEGGRSRFEVCDHQLPVGLSLSGGGSDKLLDWLEYCANQNRRLT